MKDRYTYIAIFTPEENGISIEFPDLPGCYPCADTLEEAMQNAKEAMALHIYGMEQDNEPVPTPSIITNVEHSDNDIIVAVEVFMPPYREKINNRFVKKTLSLPAWLAEKADENGVNCSKVFQNALIEYLGVNQL